MDRLLSGGERHVGHKAVDRTGNVRGKIAMTTGDRVSNILGVMLVGSVLVGMIGDVRAEDGRLLATFSYNPAPTNLILQLHLDIDMLAERDSLPMLRIYGDGTVLIHHYLGGGRSKDFRMRLSASELTRLLKSLEAGGAMDMDTASLQAHKTALMAADEDPEDPPEKSVVHASDKEIIRLKIRLDQYLPAGALPSEAGRVDQQLVWENMRLDAMLLPEDNIIQPLKAAIDELLGLRTHKRLSKVEGGKE